MYTEPGALFKKALQFTFPVFLGYSTIGLAFGLLVSNAEYPWYLAPVMSVVMYAGAAQFIALGLFASGAGLWEAALISLVVNARHLAYGFSMLNRYKDTGKYKYYLIYALTDESFALISSLPEAEGPNKGRFMFYVAALNQSYWTIGGIIGALAASFIPFNLEGLSFALTALFVVLMVEQILKIRQAFLFVLSSLVALAAVFLLPSRIALLAALFISILLGGLPACLAAFAQKQKKKGV